MTSEHNSSSYDHSQFQSRTSNHQYLNTGFPIRKPTEGEIDQFIELLKNSSTGNQSDDNIENNATQTHAQYGDSDLITEVIHFKTDSVVRSPYNKSNARVVLNDDGILMKTIQVRSQEGYLRDSERFEKKLPQQDDLKQDQSYKSSIAYLQASKDYLRKSTFLNKKSELKVTISRDQEKTESCSSGFESRGLISGCDIDTQLVPGEMIYSKKLLERENCSRDLGRSPHVKESFTDEFCDSSSYSKCSSTKSHPIGSEIRSSPTPSMYTQRRPYSGDVRNQREGSPYYYSENTNVRLKGRKDSSPNRSYHGRDKHSRYPSLSPQRSRTPSPHRRRRNSRDKEFYNPHEELGFADYGMQIHSPEMKERRSDLRYDTKKSPITIPSPPSPPPPPVLSVMKKKKTKLKSEEEQSKTKKTSINPLSTLLADRNVSISTLLEAAIGNTGEKSSSTNWNPSAKADIISRCEEKIGQLYRHRVCGPGSFIPDPVPRPSPPYANNSILVKHYPQLEFNSRSMNSIWHCPGVVEPDPQKNEIMNIGDEDDKILSTHSIDSLRSKTRACSKGNDNNVRPDENPVSRVESRIPLQATGTNMSTYESSASYRSGHEQPGDYINSSEAWQQYGSDEGRSQYNASDTSYALYQQQPAINASETYDPNNWSNSGGFNTFGYQQPQCENQQLVQYPVGHQPIGPYTQYVNNSNYFFGQNENSPFPASEFVQYPISQDMPHFAGGTQPDQWYPQNEQNIQFPGTVQYPLKQRPSVKGNDSKTSHLKNDFKLFVNPNLISLTDTKATYRNKKKSPTKEQTNLKKGEKMLPVSSSDDSKNKSKKSSKRSEVTPKINNNKQQEIVEKDVTMEKLLQLNVKIRNIQLNDDRIYNIFKDLESGSQIYSYAYTVRHKMLWRKDLKVYKLYISEPIEKAMLSLFHETFHDLNGKKLEDLAKKYLTIIPRIQEKLRYTIRVCVLCRKEKSPKRIVGQNSVRSSPHNRNKEEDRNRRSPLPHARSKRSRSPPSKKTSSKSTSSPTHHSSPTVSKERLDPGRDKSLSPYLQRHESRSLKRRHNSRSRAGRERSRRRSKHRRSTSYEKHRKERTDSKKKARSDESPEVEAIMVPTKKIEVIDLVEEEINETDDQWISYDSVGSESEEETSSEEECNRDGEILDSKKRKIEKSKRNQTESKVDISNLDVNKTLGSVGNINDLNDAHESDKYVDRGNNSTQLIEKENQGQARMDSIQEKSMDSQHDIKIKIKNDQKSESSVEEHTVVSQKRDQEQEKENVNVNKTSSNLQKDSNSSVKQGEVEKDHVKKQEEKEEQESKDKDKFDKKSIEEVIIEKKEHCEEGIETSQKQEFEEENKAKNSSTNLQEGQMLETDINQKKEVVSENTNSNKQVNKPPVQLDFKTRVRNIQLENNELKDIIHLIEVNKQDKNVDPCYLMKGGMLCKKCQIGDKCEVRIVATIEQINNLVLAVHTMSTSHSPLQKTLMLFNKHFVPMPDIDKIVEEVVSGCNICN